MGLMNTLEYRHWALQTLSPVQWVVYEIVRDLGEGMTTISAIAQWADIKRDTASAALKVLQSKQFIKYTNLGGCQGILIEWVRSTADEQRPKLDTMRYRRIMQYGHQLRSPDGKIYDIPPGKLAQFARDHDLSYRCLQHLIDGQISHHKQWKLSNVQEKAA